jgi:hypothetical protein
MKAIVLFNIWLLQEDVEREVCPIIKAMGGNYPPIDERRNGTPVY